MIIEQKYIWFKHARITYIQVTTELSCNEKKITTAKKNYLALRTTGITAQNPTLNKVATSTATTRPTTRSNTSITSLIRVKDESDFAQV